MKCKRLLAACLCAAVLLCGGCAGGTPSADIPQDALEVGAGRAYLGLIGRHRMAQLESAQPLGVQPVRAFTDYYVPQAFSDYQFTVSYREAESAALCTEELLPQEFYAGLAQLAGVAAEFAAEEDPPLEYTVGGRLAVSRCKARERTLEGSFAELDFGEAFAVGEVAEVTALTYTTWMWDDYWWGDYEVPGSRTSLTVWLIRGAAPALVLRSGSYILL